MSILESQISKQSTNRKMNFIQEQKQVALYSEEEFWSVVFLFLFSSPF